MFHLGDVPQLQQKHRGIWGRGEGVSIFLRWLVRAGKNFSKSCYNNESLINVQRRDRTISDVQEMYVWTVAEERK